MPHQRVLIFRYGKTPTARSGQDDL